MPLPIEIVARAIIYIVFIALHVEKLVTVIAAIKFKLVKCLIQSKWS